MKFFIGLCAFICVVNASYASESQENQIDSKQEKRSLSHDEWSSGPGVGSVYQAQPQIIQQAQAPNLPNEWSSGPGVGSVYQAQPQIIQQAQAPILPATVGVSAHTHTDTLTTVREKVPVPFEVIKNVPQPYPVEVIKHVDRPV